VIIDFELVSQQQNQQQQVWFLIVKGMSTAFR